MRTILVLCLFLTSCKSLPKITFAGGAVTGVADAGKPATLTQGETKTSFDVPAGTTMQVDKTDATPTAPAKEVITWNFLKPTKFEIDASTLHADTGTVDTSVAQHKIDVASHMPLLIAAIASLVAAAVMMYLEHPTAALLCSAASVIFFLSWKLSDLPDWVWAIGAAAIVGGLCLVFGHSKGVKNTLTALVNGTPPKA